MVTYEDCVALAGLSPEAVERIAAREHLPQIVALELACWLAAPTQAPPARRSDGAEGGASISSVPVRPQTAAVRTRPRAA
jgi:hypothetical protein